MLFFKTEHSKVKDVNFDLGLLPFRVSTGCDVFIGLHTTLELTLSDQRITRGGDLRTLTVTCRSRSIITPKGFIFRDPMKELSCLETAPPQIPTSLLVISEIT